MLNLDESERVAYDMIRIGSEHGLPLSLTRGRTSLGLVLYERNELEAARVQFEAFQPLPPHLPLPLRVDATIGLALTHQALGHDALATRTLRDFAEHLADTGGADVRRIVGSMETRLALARGETDLTVGASRPLQSTSFPVHLSVMEDPHATLTRVLIGLGTLPALREAAEIVDRLESSAVANHHPLRQVQAALLRALVLRSQGDATAALDLLDRVVERTRRSGLIRTFVDLGPPMHRLLVELAARQEEPNRYLDGLCAAFPPDPVVGQHGLVEEGAAKLRAQPDEAVDLLAWRELEVLALLADRLSNKEIAAKLVISPLTVKKHSINIYQKLRAAGRRDAVARAISLGLLPPD
jgi:LuxR family maltose regulon positive regulatory protein